jgi:hypothetical protein
LGDRFDLPAVSVDGNHASEELGGRNRRIVVAKPVAARNQEWFTLSCEGLHGAVRAAHYPVDEQSPLLREKHDFSGRNFAQTGALDGNQIAGKDGRRHAGAEDAKAYFAECADNFARKTTCQHRRHIPSSIHRRASAEG